jgi:hypothetical protein
MANSKTCLFLEWFHPIGFVNPEGNLLCTTIIILYLDYGNIFYHLSDLAVLTIWQCLDLTNPCFFPAMGCTSTCFLRRTISPQTDQPKGTGFATTAIPTSVCEIQDSLCICDPSQQTMGSINWILGVRVWWRLRWFVCYLLLNWCDTNDLTFTCPAK